MTIGTLKIEPNIAIAPMAGYSDLAFRRIVHELGGAGMAYTELISCHALIHAKGKTLALVATTPDEYPLGMQIFGSDPQLMAASASILEEYGADLIDINMGCPVSKVVKTGGGAVLMQEPVNAARIVKACINAVSIPVTVKIRAGWDDTSRNAPEFAKEMSDAGAAAITVHGRTRAQGYSGKADKNIIRQVVQNVNVPVIGNGDVIDGPSAADMFEETGCAGIMVGRAAMGAPWIFRQIYDYLDSGKLTPPPTRQQRGALAWKHFTYLKELYGEHIACLHIRRIACCYSKGLTGCKDFRRHAVSVESTDQVYKVLNDYFNSG